MHVSRAYIQFLHVCPPNVSRCRACGRRTRAYVSIRCAHVTANAERDKRTILRGTQTYAHIFCDKSNECCARRDRYDCMSVWREFTVGLHIAHTLTVLLDVNTLYDCAGFCCPFGDATFLLSISIIAAFVFLSRFSPDKSCCTAQSRQAELAPFSGRYRAFASAEIFTPQFLYTHPSLRRCRHRRHTTPRQQAPEKRKKPLLEHVPLQPHRQFRLHSNRQQTTSPPPDAAAAAASTKKTQCIIQNVYITFPRSCKASHHANKTISTPLARCWPLSSTH